MTVIGPTNLDATDLAPATTRSPDVASTIQGDRTDVEFFLRVVAPAYEHSYPPDIYGPPPTPAVTALSPSSIVVDTPTPCQVNGTGFTHNSHVFVDDVEQITTYVSSTVLRYTAEASSVGTQDITVVTEHAGGDLTSNSVVLNVTATELLGEGNTEQTDAASAPAATDGAPSAGGVTGGRQRKPRKDSSH